MPPRASLRPREATPARSTRAASTRLETPATRRSTRAASKQPIATRNVVSNPALPEIQTQQSYAYGSSKTPALPEQLHAKTLNISALAAHLNDAADEAERNLQAHAADLRDSTPDSQAAARSKRAQRRESRQPSREPPQSSPAKTTQTGSRSRVIDWVQNSSQLDDISEEPARSTSPMEEREREVSLPSSFPDGSFDHSYSYEKGERGPRVLPNRAVQQPRLPSKSPSRREPSRTHPPPRSVIRSTEPSYVTQLAAKLSDGATTARQYMQQLSSNTWQYLARIFQAIRKSFFELPDSHVIVGIFKSMIVAGALSLLGLFFCLAFTRYCDPSSTSIVSQGLQKVCGSCSTRVTTPTWNITNPEDIDQLLSALSQTQEQIAQVESRLNSRITSNIASLLSDASTLRAHQEALEDQIQRLNKNQSPPESFSHEISSPLIPRINFFSPANGAVVIPRLTSPTLARRFSLPVAVALRTLRIQKLLSPPPITALESWTDEGDCWCAASPVRGNAKNEGKDSVLLTIQTLTRIFPTELVVEHFPARGSLSPGATPQEIELWADFSGLTFEEWAKLHIQNLLQASPPQDWIPGQASKQKTWARIATAHYQISSEQDPDSDAFGDGETVEISANEAYGRQKPVRARNNIRSQNQGENHVQRFNLNINQNGLLHYSDRFMVRVKSNYGADLTCLYRVRLHGHAADSGGIGK